jgi:iron-regulated transporter 1
MRRIDLICKLLGPLAISSIAIVSTPIAIWTTVILNLVSILPEYFCIAKVHSLVPSLQQPSSLDTTEEHADLSPASSSCPTLSSILPLTSLSFYIGHPAFLPSLSLSLLYLTVLSLSGQMVTYLISSGFTSLEVGLIRTVSTVFELSATFLAPWLMDRIGVVRAGIWSLTWQMGWLALGGALYFRELEGGQDERMGLTLGALGLVAGVVLSRVGLWGFDLCAQSIVQDVRLLLPRS